jgi:hypothetical protein
VTTRVGVVSPGPLTAREKLEQRLDEMYWPGYSNWSSAQQRDATIDRQPRADVSVTEADRPTGARSERENPFGSYCGASGSHAPHPGPTSVPQPAR